MPVLVPVLMACNSYRRPVVWRREVPALLVASALRTALARRWRSWSSGKVSRSHPSCRFGCWRFFLFFLVRVMRHFFSGTQNPSGELPSWSFWARFNAQQVHRALTRNRRSNCGREPSLRVAAVFADGAQPWPEATRENFFIGESQWAQSFAEYCGIQHGIVAVPNECDSETAELIKIGPHFQNFIYCSPN